MAGTSPAMTMFDSVLLENALDETRAYDPKKVERKGTK
jgi:hypothetical protein